MPNRLIDESSPYLRQHAHNPVDWYPWGEEALQKAVELDRPIFLSVGYSSCHWCHVMERESFENEEIAAVMNENFISVKVDREERPDIDSIYMAAVQLMTQRGGWPMSVFLAPDRRPFWGGTYFPPPTFKEILLKIADAYREKRDEVTQTGSSLLEHLGPEEGYRRDDLVSQEDYDQAVQYARRTFDPRYGGFGPAPKFPRSVEISMLLRAYCRSGDESVLEMCERTLQGMAMGGMYDQVGGGFHRYSTDERWLVPHFEKMLYDNALLAKTYLEAYQITHKDVYRTVASEVLDYVLREMTGPEGGFFSATDADSEGEEWTFFVWTPGEVEAVLGPEDARVVCTYYTITEAGNFEGKSIPYARRSLENVVKELGLEPDRAAEILALGRRKLYDEREKRQKPFRDEKILTSWNGLMISALARGAQVLDEPRYREAAVRAAEFILETLVRDGRLLRVYKDGESKVLAFLEDYAFFSEALLDLYEATFEPRHLREACQFMDFVTASFADEEAGGFFYTATDHEQLIVRRKEIFDSATPAGGGIAALNLLRLERMTGRKEYRRFADEYFRSIKGVIGRAPMAFGSTLMGADFYLSPAVEVVVVGDFGDAATQELLRTVHATFLPARVFVAAESGWSGSLAEEIPLLEGKGLGGESAAEGPKAFVCRDFVCQAPVDTPEELRRQLEVAPSAGG